MELFFTGKTVEEAMAAAHAQLGEDVTVEIVDLPARRLFKTIPARVRAIVEEPAPKEEPAPAPAPETKAQPAPAPAPAQPEAPAPEAKAEEEAPAAPAAAPAQPEAPAAAAPGEEELDLEANPNLKAAADYLTGIFTLMGAENCRITALRQGEATVLRVDGDKMGALIGRRGETMEALSYLASLVANRQEGGYIKLGLDVGGYRSKREKDLQTLARRTAAKVAKTGRCFALEPMNPYERRIVHSAVSTMEGVRSESTGEGIERRVVIYSTAPDANNRLPKARGPRREGERRDDRRGGDCRRDDRRRDDRRGKGGHKGPRSSVPAREFADRPRDANAQPTAPRRTERIDDAADFELFGKIEL